MFTLPHISRGATRRTLALGAVLATALATSMSIAAQAPAARSAADRPAYGWPVKPFDRQHPVRGFFGDPRIGLGSDGTAVRQFHFGVDVSAPNGTPVYATLSGRVSIHPEHDDVVFIDGPDGAEFSYWHIVPSVRSGDAAVAYKTMIGHVEIPWAHVHFSEMRNGVYLNPLRPGAMGPYSDPTKPTVPAVELQRSSDAAPVARANASGSFDIVAEVADTTPLPVPPPWGDLPVMPALVQWRIVGAAGAVTDWKTAVDFRQTIPSASEFSSVYAVWTRQNHANHPGRYRIYLAHAWNSAAVQPGTYRVEVSASDTRNNTTVVGFPITVVRPR
jgi:hypothetical protein